jgi:hypothetical protein
MAPERYVGDAGTALKRQDEEANSSSALVDARAVRRDLQARVPYGRALDMEDLDEMLDDGNQSNRARVMRTRLLAYVRAQVPAGVVLGSVDVDRLRADSEADPKQQGKGPGIPEWAPAR